MHLRQQDRERQHRMSPETGEQQKFVRQWPSNASADVRAGPGIPTIGEGRWIFPDPASTIFRKMVDVLHCHRI
jgi:hypothetical protein